MDNVFVPEVLGEASEAVFVTQMRVARRPPGHGAASPSCPVNVSASMHFALGLKPGRIANSQKMGYPAICTGG